MKGGKRKIAACGVLLGCGGLAPAALQYDYDASNNPSSTNTWFDAQGNATTRDWTLNISGASPITTNSTSTSISRSYDFGGALAGDPASATATSFGSSAIGGGANASFELWFRTETNLASGLDQDVLFESGGNVHGASILIATNAGTPTLEFRTRNNTTTQVDASDTLTDSRVGDFIQAVGTVSTAAGQTRLYVNGQLRDIAVGTANWSAGGDTAGLATQAGTSIGAVDAGSAFSNFSGEIARLRLYDAPLTAREVYDRFAEIAPDADPYANAVLADDPVGFYRFGEQAGITNTANLGSTGAAIDGGASATWDGTLGEAGLVDSNGNEAGRFDGSGYIGIANSADINSGGPYAQKSVEVWFNADRVPTNGEHAVIFEQGGTSNGLNVHLNDGKAYVGAWANNSGNFLGVDIVSNQAHQIVMAYDSFQGGTNGQMFGYIDGAMFGGDNTGIAELPSHTGGIGIGAVNDATRFTGNVTVSGSDTNHFDGTIDELSLYNTALTTRKVQEHYTAGTGNRLGVTDGVTLGLILNFDASGTATSSNWTDSIGTFARTGGPDALDWTVTGASVINNPTTSHSNLTAAVAFTGSGSGATLAGATNAALDSWDDVLPTDLTLRDATLEMWFKPDDLVGKEVLFESGGTTVGSSLRLNGDQLEFVTKDSALSAALLFDLDANGDGFIDGDDFIQAVAVLDLDPSGTGVLRLFVNGSEVTNVTNYAGLDWTGNDGTGLAATTGAIGGGGSGYGAYDGQIAFFRYYDAALSDRDILTNYYAIIPEPHAPAAFVIGLLLAGSAWRRRASAAPPARRV